MMYKISGTFHPMQPQKKKASSRFEYFVDDVVHILWP